MAGRLPLTTLLAQALVAYTIEFDNEFEHRMPHRTSRGSSGGGGPWLVSLVMWSNCVRFVSDEGITIRELERLARTKTNLDGMRRWGYITIDGGASGPRPAAVLRATPAGRLADETWQPLFGLIEQRWQERFGAEEVGRVRHALTAVTAKIDGGLPDCLPILGYGLFSRGPGTGALPPPGKVGSLSLPALLSRLLLALALEFERESELSLAISANVLRALDEQTLPLRDMPTVSGVSKESIAMALGILESRGLAVVEPDPDGSRFKVVRLTPEGRKAQNAYRVLLCEVEQRWGDDIGEELIQELRESLEPLVGEPTRDSPLWGGLEPYPDGWRASVRRPETLPHFPMVLHRGGFPDGN